MFTSHKLDALPLSTDLSTDFSVTIPPSSTSTIESWTSQHLDDPPYGAMQSPEESYRPYYSTRSSVFKLRSRSNTGASIKSTVLTVSPIDMSHNDSSRPGTPLILHQCGTGDSELLGSRRSFFRGKKGKRLSDSVSSNLVCAEYQGKDPGDKRMSMLRKVRRRTDPSDESSEGFKHLISSPFDFQHISHTDRQQVATFEQNSGNKLASGLQQFPNFSSEAFTDQEYQWPSVTNFGSPPQSPLRSHQGPRQQQKTRPILRLARSVESFSRPGFNCRHSQSVLATPRSACLSPLAAIDDVPEDALEHDTRPAPFTSRSKRESGVWHSFSAPASPDTQFSGLRDDASCFGHALTTPDDSALPAMHTSFSPSLDDVAEEPERFTRPRPAPRPPTKGPTTPKSPKFATSIFTDKRSPGKTTRSRGNSNRSPRSCSERNLTSRPLSQMSDTLGCLDPVRRGSIRKPAYKRRQSNTWRAPESSWEDDIDYIYEHALEADCDLDWDRSSDCTSEFDQSNENDRRVSGHVTQEPMTTSQSAFESSMQYQPRNFRASLLVTNVPELTPTSAESVSTMGTGLITHCDSMHARSQSPSLCVPQEHKGDQDNMYENPLTSYDDSERHYPALNPRNSATSSARSRRSSYDSSLMSSVQSSGLWSSPVRRSASSAGSLPDLVTCRRRDDLSSSLVIDQLSDSMASLSHLSEEKEADNVTPPGCIQENCTLLPAEEDAKESINQRTAIEDELRASLERARQGPQRSTHALARYHKQTMSEGAAKLLSAATEAHQSKIRGRAATASQAAKSPILGLFPAPPRHPPNPHGH
ncbi:hypothetical protein BDU57DRAFT_557724 [Ampelomyces quisqualis]|uniref:CRIB domain-containing protein n=1 Tax=Ampelomyces quisqualis TaxID=50730 RepID=A0A6A5QJN6_AMPQU|nr:hypothetical protein BDU57DRAFT_557724 [Ampelomyces quisqualis]